MSSPKKDTRKVIMHDSQVLAGWDNIAAYMGIHVNTVLDMHVMTDLPVAKILGKYYTTKSRIDVWIIETARSQADQRKKGPKGGQKGGDDRNA